MAQACRNEQMMVKLPDLDGMDNFRCPAMLAVSSIYKTKIHKWKANNFIHLSSTFLVIFLAG